MTDQIKKIREALESFRRSSIDADPYTDEGKLANEALQSLSELEAKNHTVSDEYLESMIEQVKAGCDGKCALYECICEQMPPNKELVEKVAKAIADRRNEQTAIWRLQNPNVAPGCMSPFSIGKALPIEFIEDAKAAISAMPVSQNDKLPYDITIGAGTFKKGVSLQTFIKATTRWHDKYMEPKSDSHTDLLQQLKDNIVHAACQVVNADTYKHPILSRADAVKAGVSELHDAVNKYHSAQPAQASIEEK